MRELKDVFKASFPAIAPASLGPLVNLARGEKAELTERWQLFKDVPECPDEAAIDKNVLPRIMAK